jgi:hypothetical protein
MLRFGLIILFTSMLFSVFTQEIHNTYNCKIISIDSSAILPNIYIIKAQTVKGRIMILSPKNELKIDTTSEIKVNENYNLDIVKLDSILVIEPEGNYYFKFENIRGGNDRYIIYVTDQDKEVGRLEFEDFNFKPFKAINLKGLHYSEPDYE